MSDVNGGRSQVEQYHWMENPELHNIFSANRLPISLHASKHELMHGLVNSNELLTEGTPLTCIRQAADVYIAGPVEFPEQDTTSCRYDLFEIYELQDLCQRHGLSTGFTFKHELIWRLIANDSLLRGHGGSPGSCAQHDADAV